VAELADFANPQLLALKVPNSDSESPDEVKYTPRQYQKLTEAS
jgi:hypothetical protein